MTLSLIAKLQQSARSVVVLTIKRAGGHVQRSSVFKRFILKLLWRHPALKQKLRNIYYGFRLDEQSNPDSLSYTPSNLETPTGLNIFDYTVFDDTESFVTPPSPHGVNAHQRSPLEANFHGYGGPL